MTRSRYAFNDGNMEVGRVISDIDDRLDDLERRKRNTDQPNILRKQTDRVTISNSLEELRVQQLEPARWNVSGWRTSTWGDPRNG